MDIKSLVVVGLTLIVCDIFREVLSAIRKKRRNYKESENNEID